MKTLKIKYNYIQYTNKYINSAYSKSLRKQMDNRDNKPIKVLGKWRPLT